MAAKIRPVYCGNFEYDARQSEIERLFKEYGRVDRVDMKTGKFDYNFLASYLFPWRCGDFRLRLGFRLCGVRLLGMELNSYM